MLIINNLTYKLHNNITLFKNLSFTIKSNEKVALIDKNGIGKSIIFRLIIGKLLPFNGEIKINNINISYFPQKYNELNFNTVADVFGLEKQITALEKIENNNANIQDYDIIDGYWNCREMIDEKLKFFSLKFDYLKEYRYLSGGEKIKLILSSIINKNTNFLLLDEPTNNMDCETKEYFYNFIKKWKGGIFLISHDRKLLNLVDKIFELKKLQEQNTKLFIYGGNFIFYEKRKNIEESALDKNFADSTKNLKCQKNQIIQNQKNYIKNIKKGKSDIKNKKITKILGDLKKNKAEKQHGDLINRDNKKLNDITNKINKVKDQKELKEEIYFKFRNQENIKNKKVLEIDNLSFSFEDRQLFKNLSIIVDIKDRVLIDGRNGSGKSTLLNIITNEINNNYSGNIKINLNKVAYCKQNQELLIADKTILNSVVEYTKLTELECRKILAEFLFKEDAVFKKILDLSGGEKLKVLLACILNKKNIELLILDEPTNNLDLDSIAILEDILNKFNGAIIIVSHDRKFIENLNINKTILL